jgi:hypothetical protein
MTGSITVEVEEEDLDILEVEKGIGEGIRHKV